MASSDLDGRVRWDDTMLAKAPRVPTAMIRHQSSCRDAPLYRRLDEDDNVGDKALLLLYVHYEKNDLLCIVLKVFPTILRIMDKLSTHFQFMETPKQLRRALFKFYARGKQASNDLDPEP